MKRFACAIFVILCAKKLFAAEPAGWIVETGDFRQHTGSLQQLTPDALILRSSENATESIAMRDLLRGRLQVPPAPPSASESASAADVTLNQKVRVGGVDMTIFSTNASLTVLNGPDGQQRTMLTSVVRQLVQASVARSRRGTLTLELNNGDRLTGVPAKIDGSNLIWSNDLLGDVRIPLERLSRLTRSGAKVKTPTTAPSEDTATLSNGDVVHGIMSDLTGGTLSIQMSGGSTNALSLDSVQVLSFAQTAAPAARPGHAFTIWLVDGSRLTASGLKFNDAGWTLDRTDGSTQALPASSVREFEQLGGPVIWLSELLPSESSNHTLLGREWPPQFDRAVDGGALRFATREFRHGIGVHAYSRLVFDVPGGVDRLHLNYAIDGDGLYADITVRVLLDSKPVIEAAHVRAGTLATPPTIALAGCKQITLEVDYGDNQDVQDRFNWLEPALIKATEK